MRSQLHRCITASCCADSSMLIPLCSIFSPLFFEISHSVLGTFRSHFSATVCATRGLSGRSLKIVILVFLQYSSKGPKTDDEALCHSLDCTRVILYAKSI